MRENPKVVAPLARAADGSIYLGANLATVRYAIVTTAIPARAGSTFGKGAGTIRRVSYSSTGVATHQTTNLPDPVAIYSGSGATIAVGRLVMVADVDGRPHVIVDFCS